MSIRIIPIIIAILLFFSFSTAGYACSPLSTKKESIVLVTGFEPFGGYDINPSQIIAQSLDGQELDGAFIYSLVLPVDFNDSVQISTTAIDFLHPDLIISIGLEAKADAIHVEKLGINLKYDPNKSDKGYSRLNPRGPLIRFSSLPTQSIVHELRKKGIPTQLSWSAGTYICNALLYGEISYIQQHKLPIRVGFIHVPLLQSQDPNGMDEQVMLEAIKTIIQISVQQQR